MSAAEVAVQKAEENQIRKILLLIEQAEKEGKTLKEVKEER